MSKADTLKILQGMIDSLELLMPTAIAKGAQPDPVNILKVAHGVIQNNVPPEIVLHVYHNSLCRDLGRPDLMRKDEDNAC